MLLIEDYITEPIEVRKAHIDLTEACTIRGTASGKNTSTYCRGLLSHILDTTIPTGMRIHLCHACNNQICSNPKHLYWGTPQENRRDQMIIDDSTIWSRTVKKHGIMVALKMNHEGASKGGRANASKSKLS